MCAGGVARQKGKRQRAVEKICKGDEGGCWGWESEEKERCDELEQGEKRQLIIDCKNWGGGYLHEFHGCSRRQIDTWSMPLGHEGGRRAMGSHAERF